MRHGVRLATTVLSLLAGGGTAVASTDLFIQHTEHIQVVQTETNSIPLVLGKPVVVRVYVGANGTPGPGFLGSWTVGGARLQVYRGSQVFLGSLAPVNPTIPVLPTPVSITSARPFATRTFNFYVPPTMLFPGEMRFVVSINRDRAVAETNYTNNTFTRAVSFIHTRNLDVRGVLYTSPDHPYSDAVYEDIIRQTARVRMMFPVPHVYVHGFGSKMPFTTFTGSATDRYWPGANAVIARSERVRISSNTYSQMAHLILQPWDTCACGLAVAATNGPSSCTAQNTGGPNADRAGTTGSGNPMGTVVGHELGHITASLLHHGHVEDGADPNCCFHGLINSKDASTFGWDMVTMQPINPLIPGGHVHDLMSYGPPPMWVSEYAYLKLIAAFREGGFVTAPAPRTVSVGPAILLGGTVSDTGGTLDEAYVIQAATVDSVAGTGPYALVARDAGAQPLFTRHFDPNPTQPEPVRSFSELLPYDDRLASVVLLAGGVELATMKRSPTPPVVTILTPTPGAHWEGARTITWEASDADGDPLRFAVQYSATAAPRGSLWPRGLRRRPSTWTPPTCGGRATASRASSRATASTARPPSRACLGSSRTRPK